MAYITKVETKRDGVRWRLRVSLGLDPKNGKRTVITRTYRLRKEAEAEGRRLEGRRDHGVVRAPSRDPLGKYLKAWLKNTARPRVRPRTFADYEGILTRYVLEPPKDAPALRVIRMHQLTTEAIEELYGWLATEHGIGARTVGSLHAVLRSALNKAVKTGALATNPARGATVPRKKRREMMAMVASEVGAFFKVASTDPYHALWVLLVSTGLRPGEALGLKWTDLDGNRLTVQRSLTRRGVKGWELSETKTERIRTVFLPAMAVEALKAHQGRQTVQRAERLLKRQAWADHGFIFTAENGEPLDQTNIYRRNFLELMRAAELGTWREEEDGKGRTFVSKFNMYSLRHTAASLALRAGVNVKEVSAMLGHASIQLTLDTYTHLIESQQEQVAGAMQKVLAGVV